MHPRYDTTSKTLQILPRRISLSASQHNNPEIEIQLTEQFSSRANQQNDFNAFQRSPVTAAIGSEVQCFEEIFVVLNCTSKLL